MSRRIFSRETFTLLVQDRLTAGALVVIGVYFGVAALSWCGFLPVDYMARVGRSFEAPNWQHWAGTDFLGRSVFAKMLHGAEIAISVGVIASVIAIPLGASLGAIGGYFGKWVDDWIVWFYSTVNSIPQILMLLAISFVLGRGLTAIYIAVGLTSWVSICRLIRAEVMKHKEREYVLAARALGAGHARLIFRHILPNVFHLVIIDFSLRFIYAIKSEAILSYLGLGIQGEPSWGIMIADAKGELLEGHWWQLTAATVAMFFLVLALNIIGDTLRDVLDPRVSDT